MALVDRGSIEKIARGGQMAVLDRGLIRCGDKGETTKSWGRFEVAVDQWHEPFSGKDAEFPRALVSAGSALKTPL